MPQLEPGGPPKKKKKKKPDPADQGHKNREPRPKPPPPRNTPRPSPGGSLGPRPRPAPSPSPSPPPAARSFPSPSALERVASVERAAKGTIPTPVAMSLVESTLEGPEIERAAKLASKAFYIPPSDVLGVEEWGKLRDPKTGRRIDLDGVHQLVQRITPDFIERALRNAQISIPGNIKVSVGERGLAKPRQGQTTKKLDAELTARHLSVIAKNMKNEGMSFSEALGYATYLSARGADPDVLDANLSWGQRWRRTAVRESEQDFGVGGGEVLLLSAGTAVAGFAFKNMRDVVTALSPNLAAMAAEEEEQETAERRVFSEFLPEAEEALREQEGTTGVLQAFEAGDLAQFQQRVKQNFGVERTDFLKIAQDIERQAKIDRSAWENSWLNKFVVGPSLKFVDGVANGIEAGSVGIGSGAVWLGAKMRGREDIARRAGEHFRDSTGDVWRGEKEVADILHDDFGINRGLALGAEFLLLWYADPLVVGGKVSRLRRLTRVLDGQELVRGRGPLHGLLRSPGSPLRGVLEARDASRNGKLLERYANRAEGFANKQDRRLLKAIMKGDDTASRDSVRRWTRTLKNNYEARSPVSNAYIERMRQDVRSLMGKGMGQDEARVLVNEGLKAHFLFGTVDANSPVARWLRAVDGEARVARQEVRQTARQLTLDDVAEVAPRSAGLPDEAEMVSRRWLEQNRAPGPNVVENLPGFRAPDEIQNLRDSMRTRGFTEPVEVQMTPQGPVVIDGNHRLAIAQELGIEDVPVVVNRMSDIPEGVRLEDLDITSELMRPSAVGIPTRGLSGVERARGARQGAEDALEAAGTSLDEMTFGPLRMEIPTRLVPVPLVGGVKRGMMVLSESRLGDTTLGRKTRQLFNINPGGLLKIHENPERWFRLKGIRAKLPRSRVNYYESRAAELAAAGKKREFDGLLDSFYKDVADKWARRHVRDPESIKGFLDEVLRDLRGSRTTAEQQTFGVLRSEQGFGREGVQRINRPLVRSQLENFKLTIDPLDLERGLNNALGVRRRMMSSARRAFGKRYDEIKGAFNTDRVWQEAWRAARSNVLGVWKWGAVSRPAYILRVIMLDEQARQFATLGRLTERIAAQGAIGKAFRPLYRREIKFANGGKTRHIPGPADYEVDPRVNPLLDQRQLVESAYGDTDIARRWQVDPANWKPSFPSDAGYEESWARALNLQFGANSDLGDETLRLISEGALPPNRDEALAILKSRARDFTRTPAGVAERRAIGWPSEQADDWADTVAEVVYDYSLGDSSLARAARAQAVEPGDLALVPDHLKPPIHGPMVEALTRGQFAKRNGIGRRIMETWYDWNVRKPEAVLNRHPYFRQWKRRADIALSEAASASGVRLTDEMSRFIDKASTDFSLAQGKKIMFDFTENSRLGELVSFMAPFMQPFQENIAVWGHILLSRNPATVGYTRALWRLGEESGFIQKDPETGQLVIPLTGWLGAGPLLQMGYGSPGWRLTAPLSSFNLFVASAMDVPVPFSEAHIPIPLPSTSPWAGGALQMFFNNTDSRALESYLFAFGPGPRGVGEFATSMLPNWMEKALQAAFPGANDQIANGTIIDFLRMQEFMGMEPNEQLARGQARGMSLFKLFTSLFFPAAPQVKFPHDDLEQEYHDLTERLGFDKANEIFNEKYVDEEGRPLYSLITTGKTYWAKTVQVEGTDITTARVPSTETALKILRQPGFREFAQQYPALAAGLVLQSQDDEFSFETFASQVTAGDILYKNPQQFLADAERGPFFQDAADLRKSYDLLFEQLEAKRQTDTPKWEEARQEQADALLELYNKYPRAAPDYLKLVFDPASGEPVGAQWKFDSGRPSVDSVIAGIGLMDALKTPVFQQMPAGKGLQAYVNLRQDMISRMEKLGVNSLSHTKATKLKDEFESQKAQIIEDFPEAEVFLDMYFGGDLEGTDTNIRPSGYRILDRLRDRQPGRYEAFVKHQTKLDELGDKASSALRGVKEAEFYDRQRNYIDRIYRTEGPWVMRTWWKTQSASQQTQYRENLLRRPVVFMSRWDLELMGMKLSDQAAEWAQRVAATSVQSARFEQRNPGESRGHIFEARDKFIRQRLGKDPTFDQFIRAGNTWGWQFEAQGYTKGNSAAAWAWRQTVQMARYVQEDADRLDMWGEDDLDAEKRRTYIEAKKFVTGRVEEYLDWSPQFRRQWDDLQRRIGRGDRMMDILIPASHFPLMGGPGAPVIRGLRHEDVHPVGGPQWEPSHERGDEAHTVHQLQGGGGGFGKYQNGRIPLRVLAELETQRGHRARPNAARAFDAMVRAARDKGLKIKISDSYRDYDSQVRVKAEKPDLAAEPGTSNHGLGLAFDINIEDPRILTWLRNNGRRYGFVELPGEPWHWDYFGGRS